MLICLYPYVIHMWFHGLHASRPTCLKKEQYHSILILHLLHDIHKMKTYNKGRNMCVCVCASTTACCNYNPTGWILITFDIMAFTRICMAIMVFIKTGATVFIVIVCNTNKHSESHDAKNAWENCVLQYRLHFSDLVSLASTSQYNWTEQTESTVL